MTVSYQTYEDFEIEDLLLYAGIDCVVTSELASRLMPTLVERPIYTEFRNGKPQKVKRKAMLNAIDNIERMCHEYIIDMEINGFKYDVAENTRLSIRMTKEIAELEAMIFAAIGYEFEINGTNIGRILYEDFGFEKKYLTKSGEPATDGDALRAFRKDGGPEWLEWLAKRNDINAAHNTFIKTYVKDFVKPDGRIHPSYNLHGTSSFRITGDSPNLTQLPRTRYNYNIRSCYTTDDGYVFMAFDFSSAEVKILGAISRDPKLLEAIANGMDFHTLSASEMAGIKYEEFLAVLGDERHPLYRDYKERRQIAKSLTFSILYGSTAAGIALALGIERKEADRLIALYFNAFPGIKQYIEDTHSMARENGYIISPFGQIKWEFGTEEMYKGSAVYNAALRNAQNVRIQGTTSTLGLITFATLNEALKKIGCRAICTVKWRPSREILIE